MRSLYTGIGVTIAGAIMSVIALVVEPAKPTALARGGMWCFFTFGVCTFVLGLIFITVGIIENIIASAEKAKFNLLGVSEEGDDDDEDDEDDDYDDEED